jgi:uncharacterized membrane protein (DUF373 family)
MLVSAIWLAMGGVWHRELGDVTINAPFADRVRGRRDWPRKRMGACMDGDEAIDKETAFIIKLASNVFLKVEVFAYLVLGLLLALTAILGAGSAAVHLWWDMQNHIDAKSLVLAIDRLLFVLMVVEILHTVRVSFRSGTLVSEPFLVVGLIASIRRVLAITLESSQVNEPGKWTPETQALLNSTMIELGVLGALILIMVISICLLRYSVRGIPSK